LGQALEAIEWNATRTPLDADRAFERLSVAAATAGFESLQRKAQARCDHYRAKRRAAALEFTSDGYGWEPYIDPV
jgi:hypothetical protein